MRKYDIDDCSNTMIWIGFDPAAQHPAARIAAHEAWRRNTREHDSAIGRHCRARRQLAKILSNVGRIRLSRAAIASTSASAGPGGLTQATSCPAAWGRPRRRAENCRPPGSATHSAALGNTFSELKMSRA